MNLICIYYPNLESRNAQPSYNPEHIFNFYLGLYTTGVFKLFRSVKGRESMVL